MEKKEKKVKEVRVLDMTPEQYERNKKIAIIGSVILGLLIIALFVTLFTVYIIEKKNEDKDKNILKDSLVISSNVLQEFKDKKPLDQIGFTDKVKNEILANKPSEVVFFLFKQDLDTKILNKIKQLKVKNDALFLTLNLTLDGKTTHEYESILKQFYDAYKQEGEAWDEYKGFNDLTITPYMFKIDSNNLELKDMSPITGDEKVGLELDKYLQ